MNVSRFRLVRYLCVVPLIASNAIGQNDANNDAPPSDAEPAHAIEGLLPVPDYSGDWVNRAYLTGDWGGHRTDWARMGIQADVQWTQTLQSVIDGGRDTTTRYGSSFDYNLLLDLQRMGLMPGALIKFRAESKFGGSVNSAAGPLLPVNTDSFFPLNSPNDDDIDIAITSLTYIQFFSEQFGVLMGKLDTLDGDANEFASGRGTSQFLNANFVFNSVTALTVPYSTLGVGVIWMPMENLTVTSSLINSTDSSTSSGFDDVGDGWMSSSEVQWQYRLAEKPGGVGAGFLYSADSNFAQLGGRFVFQPGQGIVAPTEDDSWALYANAWQYVWLAEPHEAKIDLANGEADARGIGLFARLGFADEDTNPIEWSASIGVGGKGIIPARESDTFGVGYYYSEIQDTRLGGFLGVDDNSDGFEAFYNLALTPAAHLTLDIQYVDAPTPGADAATLLGMRLNLRF